MTFFVTFFFYLGEVFRTEFCIRKVSILFYLLLLLLLYFCSVFGDCYIMENASEFDMCCYVDEINQLFLYFHLL